MKTKYFIVLTGDLMQRQLGHTATFSCSTISSLKFKVVFLRNCHHLTKKKKSHSNSIDSRNDLAGLYFTGSTSAPRCAYGQLRGK